MHVCIYPYSPPPFKSKKMFCRHILIDVCMDYATGNLTVSKSSSITVFIYSNEGQVQKLFSKVYLDA